MNNNTKGKKKGKKLILRGEKKDKIFFKMKNYKIPNKI